MGRFFVDLSKVRDQDLICKPKPARKDEPAVVEKLELRTLEDLMAPLELDEFLEEYWEKRFLHLSTRGQWISEYFSLQDVDRWLNTSRGKLFVGTPMDSQEGVKEYRSSDISASVAYAAFRKGSPLVLEPLEEWPSLADLGKSLGAFFHATVGIKGFVIPDGAETFPVHAAGQDLLVLQVEGEKRWNLHESRLLQVNPPQKKTFKFPLQWYGRTGTPVEAEVLLKPGDVLYVPRGTPYQALPRQSGPCLYLAITITPLVWMDFLKTAAEYVALHSEDLRRALPPGFVGDEGIGEGMRETFQKVMDIFTETVSFDEVLASVKRNRITQQQFPSDGHFEQLAALDQLDADSWLERRDDILCAVDVVVDIHRVEKSAIFFGNEQVVGPLALLDTFRFVRDNPRFRVSEMPGLEEQSQRVLARRLIMEGLLRRSVEDDSEPES